ncbi:MAG: hypothetical protein JWM15_787, partial [Cryptosporangiaceae bacterium]|nr:hypothetical protein [Cryptosporangiaceae bacterium]
MAGSSTKTTGMVTATAAVPPGRRPRDDTEHGPRGVRGRDGRGRRLGGCGLGAVNSPAERGEQEQGAGQPVEHGGQGRRIRLAERPEDPAGDAADDHGRQRDADGEPRGGVRQQPGRAAARPRRHHQGHEGRETGDDRGPQEWAAVGAALAGRAGPAATPARRAPRVGFGDATVRGRSPRGEGASAVARTVGSWGVARTDGARVVPAQSGGSPSGGDHATGRDGVRRTGSPEPTVAIPAGSLRPRVRRRQPGSAAWRSPLWRPQSSPRRRQPVASQRPGAPGPDAAPVGPPARSGPTPAGSGGKVHPRCPPSTHPTGSRRGSARLGPGRRHTGGTAIPPPERPAVGAARAARPR